MRKLLERLGYRITPIRQPVPHEDSFLALQRMLHDVAAPVIFDVGAHHGHITRFFRHLCPRSRVYAFEPFPESFQQLKANTAADDGVIPLAFGLSDREGPRAFHSNPSSATNSLLSTDAAGPATWKSGLLETTAVIEAPFRTLDAFAAEARIERVDLLKLDVQGAEHLVMDGAAAMCARGGIRLIYSEIITQPTYEGQKRFDQALAAFYDRGFDLYDLYNPSVTREGRLRQVDAIFTRRDA